MGCGSSAQACQLTAEEAADVDTFLAGAHNAEKLQEEVAQLNEEDPKELVSHSLPAPPGPPDAGTTPHDLAKDGDDKKVFVALLSGKDCECLWLQDRTIRQLKEEAQQKLDLTIKNLIGPNMEPLDEEKMLAEENVMPGTTLTVVAVNQAAEDEKEAADCDNDILRAAKHGRLGAVRHLLRTVPGAVAAKDLDGTTALHFAAREGHAEICRVLLAAKAEVDARDFFGGATALFWAAGNVHAEICRVLLAARAEVDARDKYGHTPLHQAALTDNVESCQVLLAAGAEVDARNSNGRTPLHFEAQAGCVEVVKLLLEAKASVTVKDSDGDTPLDDARRKGHDEIITMLERAA